MTRLDIFDNPNVYLVVTVRDMLDFVDKDFIMSENIRWKRFNEGVFIKCLRICK
jgi:hypothetical protein